MQKYTLVRKLICQRNDQREQIFFDLPYRTNLRKNVKSNQLKSIEIITLNQGFMKSYLQFLCKRLALVFFPSICRDKDLKMIIFLATVRNVNSHIQTKNYSFYPTFDSQSFCSITRLIQQPFSPFFHFIINFLVFIIILHFICIFEPLYVQLVSFQKHSQLNLKFQTFDDQKVEARKMHKDFPFQQASFDILSTFHQSKRGRHFRPLSKKAKHFFMRFLIHFRCFWIYYVKDRATLMLLTGFHRQKTSKDYSRQKYQGTSIYGRYYNNQSYWTKQMSFNQAQCDQPAIPVYGFLCQETNVFYAFQTQEEYLEFIEWLESQAQEPTPSNCGQMLSDEEIKLNSEKATANIMKIFEDPIFHHEDSMMEMEEIDF